MNPVEVEVDRSLSLSILSARVSCLRTIRDFVSLMSLLTRSSSLSTTDCCFDSSNVNCLNVSNPVTPKFPVK